MAPVRCCRRTRASLLLLGKDPMRTGEVFAEDDDRSALAPAAISARIWSIVPSYILS